MINCHVLIVNWFRPHQFHCYPRHKNRIRAQFQPVLYLLSNFHFIHRSHSRIPPHFTVIGAFDSLFSRYSIQKHITFHQLSKIKNTKQHSACPDRLHLIGQYQIFTVNIHPQYTHSDDHWLCWLTLVSIRVVSIHSWRFTEARTVWHCQRMSFL